MIFDFPALPLPFVATLFILSLMAWVSVMHVEQDKKIVGFLLLIALATAALGLRSITDWQGWRFVQVAVASVIPLMVWLSFQQAKDYSRIAKLHYFAPLAMILTLLLTTLLSNRFPLLLTTNALIDLGMIALYVGYGIALCRTSLQPTVWANLKIDALAWAEKAMLLSGLLLLGSAVSEILIVLDFIFFGGQHFVWIVTLGYLINLPCIAIICIWLIMNTQEMPVNSLTYGAEMLMKQPQMGVKAVNSHESVKKIDSVKLYQSMERAQAVETRDVVDDNPDQDLQAEADIANTCEQVLNTQSLYLDPDLTLNKLARKVGVPSKQISRAINLIFQQNISQWINGYRIAYACELLRTTELPITQVYLRSGFQTKSNFHREFERIVGDQPSRYRQQHSERGNRHENR